jgi:polar amino acid transport system substrate-binding protein
MIEKLGQTRKLLTGILLIPMLLLVGCGAEPTATSVPAAAPTVAATDTAAPAAAATNTTAPAAATDTAPAATATEAMAGTTPTEAAGGGASTEPTPAPTPVSQWVPGKYAKSIPAPSKLVKGGTLTVGSDASYPPQEYVDASGKPVGLDIDIASEIASRMGLEMNVVNFKFDDIIPGLNAGQFDIVISAMTITDERSKVVDFVPYFNAGQAVLVQKGNPKGIKTLDDLSGKTAVAEQGTTEEQTLKDLNAKLEAAGKPKVNVLTYPTDTDAVDQLRIGRADATLHDSPVAAYYAELNANAFEVAIPNFDSAPEGIATAKNNTAMHDAVDAAIKAMKADGTLNAILTKWGISTSSQ